MTKPNVLIISNPPHGSIEPAQAAAQFGLSEAEVRMKANYRIPEIWLAATDRERAEETARVLKEDGFDVVVVDSGEIEHLPAAVPVKSFSFEPDGLELETELGPLKLTYGLEVVAALCEPQANVATAARRTSNDPFVGRMSTSGMFASGFGPSLEREPQVKQATAAPPPRVDLMVRGPREVSRYELTKDTSGLESFGTAPLDALAGFAKECEARFSRAQVDRRMLAMRVRQHPLVGSVDIEARKGFSYASTGLNQLLQSIAPDLKNMSQAELSSRLVHLTHR